MTEGRADAGLGYQIDGEQKMSQNLNIADRAGVIE
jgi:predicted FMN-binding regulatory protein PaiB